MYERARMLGGELAVTSRPGKGTQVTLVIPVETGTRD
jgi:signal transduction histidine kinase